MILLALKEKLRDPLETVTRSILYTVNIFGIIIMGSIWFFLYRVIYGERIDSLSILFKDNNVYGQEQLRILLLLIFLVLSVIMIGLIAVWIRLIRGTYEERYSVIGLLHTLGYRDINIMIYEISHRLMDVFFGWIFSMAASLIAFSFASGYEALLLIESKTGITIFSGAAIWTITGIIVFSVVLICAVEVAVTSPFRSGN